MLSSRPQAKKHGVGGGSRQLVKELNRALRESSALGGIFAEEVALRMGINRTDLECLDIIGPQGRASAGDIARRSGLTTGAVTGVIDRLEKAGYVVRERDPADRRKVYVTMLPAAAAQGGKYYGSLERAVTALINRYDDKEIALLAGYFTQARDIMLREIEKLRKKDGVGGKRTG